ncbi:metallopeptidase family protein [Streptomyces chumphonensis]|uniref:metallopeptidase family protein n=1 Tax=Streptomyces chumphonensis TaxID=1214925 RepID=UPI003D722F8F
MSNAVPPSRPPDRARHRDRHGRGMRGPLAPPQVPLAVSRSASFDHLVQDSAERLERQWPQLSSVAFGVQEVPLLIGDTGDLPDVPDVWDGLGSPVPLGRLVPARGGRPAQVIVYRRPVELRSKSREERALLVHEVVVEQVAELLGLSPETVDPRYGQD